MENQVTSTASIRYEKPEIIDLGSAIGIQGGVNCPSGSAATNCLGNGLGAEAICNSNGQFVDFDKCSNGSGGGTAG